MSELSLPPHLRQDDVDALLHARHADPFRVLGLHKVGRSAYLVVLLPDAVK